MLTIITSDERCVFAYNSETKQQSLQSLHSQRLKKGQIRSATNSMVSSQHDKTTAHSVLKTHNFLTSSNTVVVHHLPVCQSWLLITCVRSPK